MKLISNLEELPDQLRGGAVSIGNFDGIHRGHERIISRLRELAAQVDGPAVVFTFDPHPVRVLRPEQAPSPLTWTRRKRDLLERLHVDGLVAYPTAPDLLQLSPEDFFQRIVRTALRARAMVEGPNFFFGHNRAGNVHVLQQLCAAHRMPLEIVAPLVDDGEFVSSSRVRKAIAAGDVDLACRLLTQPYRLRGMVTHGAARGTHIGFPTANLSAIDTLVPAAGVYAGRGYLRGEVCAAAINVGPNPTFGESSFKVEVHLLDVQESFYGEPLEVDFLSRLRDIQPFPSVTALVAQLNHDIAHVREIVDGSV